MEKERVSCNIPSDKKIPMHKVFMPSDVKEIINPLEEVFKSGWIGEGPKVREFENLIGNFIGNNKVTALNNCTSALHMALRLADVKAGDEVISTPMTCTATNIPILHTGAKIIWTDINPKTGNIDLGSIKKKITDKTRAIILVHWGGYPCDLEEINEIAGEKGIRVIEDAAHAIGSLYKGRMIGNHSDFACFSFQAIKHITTGDGGIIACKNKEDYEKTRLLKWYGIPRETRKPSILGHPEYDILEAGYKFHMNDISAAIGIAQFKYLDNNIAIRRRNAKIYDELSHPKLKLCETKMDRNSAYWLYTLLVKDRIDFIKKLASKGIEASVVHIRNDSYSIFKHINNKNLPGLEKFTKEMICIPVGHWVTEEDADFVVNAVKEGW